MCSTKRSLVTIAALAVGLAVSIEGKAVSLEDLLVAGAKLESGNGVTYSEFEVKIKGKGLSKDLSEYYIVPTLDGFLLTGDFSETKKGGKLKLEYTVSGPSALEIEGAALGVGSGTGTQGKLSAKEKLHGSKKIDLLKVALKKDATKASDGGAFGARSYLHVSEKIKIKGDYFRDGSDSSVDHSFIATVPEPATALMLAVGLAGLSVARRRASG
jgi:hypothetical protein